MGGGTNIKEKGGEGGGIGRGSIGLGITIVKGGTSPWQIPVHLGLFYLLIIFSLAIISPFITCNLYFIVPSNAV